MVRFQPILQPVSSSLCSPVDQDRPFSIQSASNLTLLVAHSLMRLHQRASPHQPQLNHQSLSLSVLQLGHVALSMLHASSTVIAAQNSAEAPLKPELCELVPVLTQAVRVASSSATDEVALAAAPPKLIKWGRWHKRRTTSLSKPTSKTAKSPFGELRGEKDGHILPDSHFHKTAPQIYS